VAKHCIASLLVGAALISSAFAANVPCDSLLPVTTKGFLSIPDVAQFVAKWNETQLGHLVNDPMMKPFVDDLREQLNAKLAKSQVKLGVTLDELDGICGGEFCVALIQPENDAKRHAAVMLVDITDRAAKAAEVVDKISKNLLGQGAKKRVEKIGDVSVSIFTMPKKRAEDPAAEAYYVTHRDMLIAANDRDTTAKILARLNGQAGDTLSNHPAYIATMQRCTKESGTVVPHVRWFVEPISCAEAARAASGGRKKRGTDLLRVLRNQGFDAIQGVGGHVILATGDEQLVHRTMIYAPPVPRADGSANPERYNLAARMMAFPNSENLQPQPWVSRDLGTYFTFNWKMIEAFEYSKTLVNEMLSGGEDTDLMEDVIRSLAEDKDGPHVDLRTDLVHHLAERVTVITDCRRPVTPDSERRMFAIELTNPEAVSQAIDKAFDADAEATQREFEGHIIWEIIADDTPADVEPIRVEGDGFDPFAESTDPLAAEDEKENRILPNSAITVADGHLLVASHVDFIVDYLRRAPGTDMLTDAADYRQVQDTLAKFVTGPSSFRFFTRTDEAYLATYELIKQGKMPESKTLLAQLLNRLFGPDEEGILREQQIDGTKMPEYDAVRRYLGAAGAAVQSEEDGWFMSGCLLSKDAQ